MLLTLFFCDMWGYEGYRFNPKDNFFYNMLSLKYDVSIDPQPDLLIFSCFGDSYKTIRAKRKIYFSSELINEKIIDPALYDLHLGIEPMNGSKMFVFFPHWVQYVNWFNIKSFKSLPQSPRYISTIEEIHYSSFDSLDFHKRKPICTFINNPTEFKLRTLLPICERYPIDHYGSFMNNTGGPLRLSEFDKLFVQGQYKLSFCAENISRSGYISEKLLHCLATKTIPIYDGDSSFESLISKNRVLYTGAFSGINEINAEIENILTSTDYYRSYLGGTSLNLDYLYSHSPLALLDLIVAKLELDL